MGDLKEFKYVGTRVVRPDGVDKVTGRANYGADYFLPGMLQATVLRSPHAHAKIKSIDTSAAEASEGVLAVVTGADFPDVPAGLQGVGEAQMDMRDLSHNIMARDKVLYHGHAVAAVAATSVAKAKEAMAKIIVDYEVLTPVMDIETAIKDEVVLHDDQFTMSMTGLSEKPSNIAAVMPMMKGDVESGFAESDVVIEREFTTPTVHQGYIEPHAVVADTDEKGQADVWVCTQGAFAYRGLIASILQRPISTLKVTPSEIGGGFGGKTTIYLEPIAILLSEKAGKPVKMTMTREEVIGATGPTSGSRVSVKIGAKKDGTIVAAKAKLEYEAGAFKGSPMMPGVMCIFTPYNIENVDIIGYDICVNKPKVAAYRAPGAPAAHFACESVLDEIAREIGMDPIDLRLKNAVSEGSQAIYGVEFKKIGFVECLEAAKNSDHYKSDVAPGEGRGVAAGFWFNVGMASSAQVSLNEDGSLIVSTGNPDIGGSRASMALMAAEETGVPYENITAIVADTDNIGYCDVTGGSRTTNATGLAVIEASRDVVRQVRERVAQIWETDVENVGWSDGTAIPLNGVEQEPMPIAEVAAQAAHTGGPIGARKSLAVEEAGPAFAVHICDLKVDKETGKTDVTRYTVVQDAGKAISPAYVEGQMQGGASQGIGWALNEEYVYDEKGVLQNPIFLDYRMPVALDLPMIDAIIVEVPSPTHPYGIRGVGEVPICPPLAACANALRDAIDVRVCDLPLSPPRVLAAIDSV